MMIKKQYIQPCTSVFQLNPKERLMWELEGTGDKGSGPITGGAPIRRVGHPLD